MQQSISAEDVDMLTELVHKMEAVDGILSDWSLPGTLEKPSFAGCTIR